MKNAKRVVSILCVLFLLFAVGCSNGSGADNGNGAGGSAPEADTTPVTLRMMWWGGDARHNATVEALDLFTERNPHITIEPEYGGWDGYRDKLITQLTGGNPADLVQCSFAWGAEFQSQGQFFVDIEKYNIIDLSEFDKNFVDQYCRHNGELIALPSGVSPFSFTINTELLGNAGFDYNVEWTWDTVIEAGTAIQAYDSGAYLMPPLSGEGVRQNIFLPILVSKTGKLPISDDFELGFTKEDALEAARYVKRLVDEKIAQPAAEGVGLANELENPLWVDRKIGGFYSWSSSLLLNLDPWVDVAQNVVYPHTPGSADTGILAPPAQLYVVPEKGHPTQAIQLLNFLLTDPDALKILKDVRAIPTSNTGLRIAEEEGFIHPLVLDSAEKGIANAGMAYNQNSNNQEFYDIIKDAFDKMLLGGATAEAVVDEIFARVPDKLAELKAAAGQ